MLLKRIQGIRIWIQEGLSLQDVVGRPDTSSLVRAKIQSPRFTGVGGRVSRLGSWPQELPKAQR